MSSTPRSGRSQQRPRPRGCLAPGRPLSLLKGLVHTGFPRSRGTPASTSLASLPSPGTQGRPASKRPTWPLVRQRFSTTPDVVVSDPRLSGRPASAPPCRLALWPEAGEILFRWGSDSESWGYIEDSYRCWESQSPLLRGREWYEWGVACYARTGGDDSFRALQPVSGGKKT